MLQLTVESFLTYHRIWNLTVFKITPPNQNVMQEIAMGASPWSDGESVCPESRMSMVLTKIRKIYFLLFSCFAFLRTGRLGASMLSLIGVSMLTRGIVSRACNHPPYTSNILERKVKPFSPSLHIAMAVHMTIRIITLAGCVCARWVMGPWHGEFVFCPPTYSYACLELGCADELCWGADTGWYNKLLRYNVNKESTDMRQNFPPVFTHFLLELLLHTIYVCSFIYGMGQHCLAPLIVLWN